MTQRAWIRILKLFLLLVIVSPRAEAQWIQIESDHYRFVGDVDRDDLVEAARRFEAFHSAVSELFAPRQYPRMLPATVVVVDDDDELKDLGFSEFDGYFLADAREDYVFTLRETNRRRPSERVFHDYFHSVAERMIPNAPLWLKEGMAEFYRTVQWSGDGLQLEIGRPISEFARRARDEGERMSFDDVFSFVDTSDDYDETNRDDIFHAQSWALIHFLITRNEGRGYAETLRLVRLMASGESFEEAVNNALGLNFRALLGEFDERVRGRGTYPYLTLTVTGNDGGFGLGAVETLVPADVEAHRAELLIRRGEADSAEALLRSAVSLDPEAVRPPLVLARMLIDQGRNAEALSVLDGLPGSASATAETHYYFARALLGSGSRPGAAQVGEARDHLRAAIRLDPGFAEARYELSRSYLPPLDPGSAVDDLGEAAASLDVAVELMPQNPLYRLALGEILMLQARFADARTAVVPLVDEIYTEETRLQARAFLQRVQDTEGSGGVRGEGFAEIARARSESGDPTPEPPDPPARLDFERFELTRIVRGTQQEGLLQLIDCRDGLTLTVASDSGTLLFHTDTPERVEFATFTSDVGAELGCGPLDPPRAVIITFREAPESSEFNGVPNKVEFIAAP